MARSNNSIQPMAGSGMAMGRKRRIGLTVALVLIVALGLAWYDGGEEPIRPIVQDIPVPEGR